MPCYQINQISVEFRAKNLPLVEKAVKALGLQLRKKYVGGWQLQTTEGIPLGVWDGETITTESYRKDVVNKLRVQYAKEVVGTAAQRLGWQKTQVTSNKLKVRKGM